MPRFAGKSAVITGAAQGIGAATAEWLSREGASVALLDLDGDGAKSIASRITAAGAVAIGLKCDVTSSEEVESAIDIAAETFGTIDVLVSNAGITRDALLFKMTEDEWDIVIDTHLKGTFLCSKAAQRHMVKQRYGKIVAISSVSALGNRGQANYSAAKAGMQGFVKTAAIELGAFNINVNAVAPGHIDTQMTRNVAERIGVPYEVVKEETINLNAIKRVGMPDDIAAAVAFLASDEAGYITGQVLYVTGRPVN